MLRQNTNALGIIFPTAARCTSNEVSSKREVMTAVFVSLQSQGEETSNETIS